MTMTNLQLRQRLADLAAEYSAKRRALLAEYNAIDQGAARVERAAYARRSKGAREWLAAWELHPHLMALIKCTPEELAEARLACDLDPSYTYDVNCHKVTRTA